MLQVRREGTALVQAEPLNGVRQAALGKAQDAVQVAQALGVLNSLVAIRHPHNAVDYRPAGAQLAVVVVTPRMHGDVQV